MQATIPPWMARATELTRAGRLAEATALIQSSLQQAVPAATGSAAAAHGGDVIDVIARRVDGPPPDPAPQAPAASPDVPPARAPQPGGSAGEEQFLSGRFTGSTGSRAYRLYIPPGDRHATCPLLVMLHGCTQDPDDFARGTRMNALAREAGCLVLYPAQVHKANSSGCWNWFKQRHQQRGQGEAALLAGMVQEVLARQPVDRRRVYVAGLSAGGAMAAVLGQAYPELFAAVGVHSGLPAGVAGDLPSALAVMQAGPPPAPLRQGGPPVIVFHGDQDRTVHPANGDGVVQACAPGAVRQTGQGHANGRAYTCHRLQDGQGGVRAEHWVVHGAGHAWSGGSTAGSFTDPAGPDASREMLRFFLEHPHPVEAS